MRDYAKLAPTFWTGRTGRALKRRGFEGVIVALYLVSSPHSNMLGLYYQPKLYLAEETGLPIEGASKGLQDCIECGFCSYDEETKTVWVHEMAAWQVADSLSQADKRCKGIQKDYDALPDNPFLGPFFDRYQDAFHLTKRRDFEGDPEDAFTPKTKGHTKGHTKPHRSQEQEQEQEQEPLTGVAAKSPRPAKKCPPDFTVTDDMVTWARTECPGVSISAETPKFRDHTFATAATDWPGRWRNWMRKAAEMARPSERSSASAGRPRDIFEGNTI